MYYYTREPDFCLSEMEVIKFPLGTKIVERKYSLNPGYTEFTRTDFPETNWKGGLFDSAPANIPTNLSKGAVGYFAALRGGG